MFFHRDAKVDDGRYNNNGWLQELPDPDHQDDVGECDFVEPENRDRPGRVRTSRDKENNDLQVPWVKIQLGGREIEGPVWIQPGLADNTLGLALGYGRKKTGRVGRGSGYDAYQLRTTAAPHIASGAKLIHTPGATHPLSTTQNHWSMEGRPVVREANLTQYPRASGVCEEHEVGRAAQHAAALSQSAGQR